MSWWQKIFGGGSGDGAGGGKRASEPAKWLPANATPFGFPVLDLISVTRELLSTSERVEEAEMSMSWGGKTVAKLDAALDPAESVDCDLRYAAEPDLPDGWLFAPSCMEQKWVIAFRKGRILLLRSWTSQLKAVAEVTHEGGELRVHRLHLADRMLRTFGGEPVQTFDWILRSHALGQVVPLPCDEDGAKMLEAVPVAVFSHHGNMAAYAATTWAPPPPVRPLRATSAVVTAVRLEQPRRLAKLASRGVSLNARGAVGGYTALHVAATKGSVKLARQLLELGADPNILDERGCSALIAAIVHRGPVELLELLAQHGADVSIPNQDGFGALHAVAEVGNPEPLQWLLAQGLDLEQRTNHGHTPLQIAAALGRVPALEALLAAGADPTAESRDGQTAREIALAEGKAESVAALDRWAKRRR